VVSDLDVSSFLFCCVSREANPKADMGFSVCSDALSVSSRAACGLSAQIRTVKTIHSKL